MDDKDDAIERLTVERDAALTKADGLEQTEARRLEEFAAASERLKVEPSDKEAYPTPKQMRAELVALRRAARRAIESLPIMGADFDGRAVDALQALLPVGKGGA